MRFGTPDPACRVPRRTVADRDWPARGEVRGASCLATIAPMSQAPYGPTPPNRPASDPSSPPGRSRLPIITPIAIALIAVAIAIGSWFRPVPKPESPPLKTYSTQEVADAKKAVCGAYERADRGVQTAGANTAEQTSTSTSTSTLAVATNVRLALVAGNSYLTQSVLEYPAAPTELTTDVAKLARAYLDIAINQLGQVPHTQLRPFFRTGDEASSAIRQICK